MSWIGLHKLRRLKAGWVGGPIPAWKRRRIMCVYWRWGGVPLRRREEVQQCSREASRERFKPSAITRGTVHNFKRPRYASNLALFHVTTILLKFLETHHGTNQIYVLTTWGPKLYPCPPLPDHAWTKHQKLGVLDPSSSRAVAVTEYTLCFRQTNFSRHEWLTDKPHEGHFGWAGYDFRAIGHRNLGRSWNRRRRFYLLSTSHTMLFQSKVKIRPWLAQWFYPPPPQPCLKYNVLMRFSHVGYDAPPFSLSVAVKSDPSLS